ncbi:MAG TPA: alpha/beta hydrolase [Mobilitalea sp.]|nr:alpha/beta hydrolase [Mobilitalea sp.]
MLTLYHNLRKVLNQSFPTILLFINVLSIALGFMYFLGGQGILFPNPYGILMLAAFLGNIGLAFKEEQYKVLGYLYLTFSSIWMLLIMIINTAASLTPTIMKTQSILSAAFVFSLFLLGGNIAGNKVFERKDKVGKVTVLKAAQINVKKNLGNYIKNIVIILFSIVLYCGLFIAINLLKTFKNVFFESVISEYALFFAIMFLSTGVLIIKLLDRKKYHLYYNIVLPTTIFIFLVCMLPLISIPSLLKNAEKSFREAFGESYKTNINYQGNYFRQSAFSIPEYFYGVPSDDYQVSRNIHFYKGTEGVDKGLELYFDVYSPVKDGRELPGGNSVIIRIHGGGWTSGNKGASNFAQMNKYFAEQGYIVFDIQYGLNDVLNWLHLLPVSQKNIGKFTIDDMVRHIGIFTSYLADHREEFKADINSVFISGGSAGGQLTLASGLGLSSGKYSSILNPEVHVKGLIPFYPANGLSQIFEIGGQMEFVDPALLVSKDSPPGLIYQGDHDGLVSASIAKKFRNTYIEKGNKECTVILMPFGGHGSDLYFPGYYNQIFLYYMERFIYQYK